MVIIDANARDCDVVADSVRPQLDGSMQRGAEGLLMAEARPLGAYVRLVVAGAVGLAAQRFPLERVNIGPDEPELAAALEHHLKTSLDDLTVEQRVVWGALMLYAIARGEAARRTPQWMSSGIRDALVSFIESGIAFWQRKGVLGAEAAFQLVGKSIRVLPETGATTGGWQLCTRRMPRMLGRERVSIRVEGENLSGASALPVGFRVPGRNDIRIVIEDAPGAELRDDAVLIPIGDEWTEVLFHLVGTRMEQVTLEAWVPDTTAAPSPIDGSFNVGTDARTTAQQTTKRISQATAIHRPEHDARSPLDRLFEHIRVHGYITELEATKLLGSARAFRAFSLEFETHVKKVAFGVRVETTADGKRYIKEDER